MPRMWTPGSARVRLLCRFPLGRSSFAYDVLVASWDRAGRWTILLLQAELGRSSKELLAACKRISRPRHRAPGIMPGVEVFPQWERSFCLIRSLLSPCSVASVALHCPPNMPCLRICTAYMAKWLSAHNTPYRSCVALVSPGFPQYRQASLSSHALCCLRARASLRSWTSV